MVNTTIKKTLRVKIIKLKISNFFLILFFTAVCALSSQININAQDEPTAVEPINSPPAGVQSVSPPVEENPAPKVENPVNKPNPSPPPKPQPQETAKQVLPAAPSENSEKKPPLPQEQAEKKDEPPPLEKNKQEIPPKPELPEVSENEINQYPFAEIPQNENRSKNLIKTTAAWILILAGILLIIKVIIGNKKIPKNYEPHIKSKYGFKPGKKKNKYNLKYK